MKMKTNAPDQFDLELPDREVTIPANSDEIYEPFSPEAHNEREGNRQGLHQHPVRQHRRAERDRHPAGSQGALVTVEFRNTVVQISWNGRELQQAVDTEKAAALYEGARVIEDRGASSDAEAKRTACASPAMPRRPAASRVTAGARAGAKPPKLKPGTAVAGFSQFYGGFQERGTRRHRAQPFLGPALEGNRTRATRAARDHMARAVGL